ncbi:MAG TPA: hypothetical protein VFO65_13495 [Acidimicrobiales bacterium]|nr:hypothetical protein [Acidimicrobiales bacterium]
MKECPTCGQQLVQVPVKIGEHNLVMDSCSICDIRRWERDGEVIDLTEVLDLTVAHQPPPSSRPGRPRKAR